MNSNIFFGLILFDSIVLGIYFIYLLYLRRASPPGIMRGDGVNDKRKTYISPNRDRFLKKKIPAEIDAIIIGSGIGGLSCAAFLSRVGKRCLVLEQHYIAGGCTHSFVEHGYEFDTGVHYVGNIEKRRKILDLITDNPS